jgi:N-acetylglucosamine malate deacetylase 1
MELWKMKTLLAIGAHHDDLELECGGTIAKYSAEGWRCVYVVATNTPHYNPTVEEINNNSFPDNQQIVKIREAESRAGAKVIGASEVHFWNFKSPYYYMPNSLERWRITGQKDNVDGYKYLTGQVRGRELISNAQVLKSALEFVGNFIKKISPDVILTHNPADRHIEHHCTATLVREALMLCPLDQPYRLFASCECSSFPQMSQNFTHFVDISKYFEIKMKAAECFKSQFMEQKIIRERFETTYRKRDKVCGEICGVKYAEPFTEFEPVYDDYYDYWDNFISSNPHRAKYLKDNVKEGF